MTDSSTPGPAERLHAALGRIARLAERPASIPAPPPPALDPALTARLDDLILKLRDALDEEPADGPDQP